MTIKDINQIELELNEKIPRDVISLRDGGGRSKLSYLEGWYVIDRLNKIFGPLGWAKEIIETRLLEGPKPSYLVKVRLTVQHAGSITVKEGYGYGSDKSGLNPHELAIKEAVTDALKVAAKDLGMSMGLALYDKTQENVEDVKDDVQEKSAAISVKPVGPKLDVVRELLVGKPNSTGSKETLSEAIKSYFKVAEAQKKLTKDEFRSNHLGLYGVSKVDELSHEQMSIILEKLKEITK